MDDAKDYTIQVGGLQLAQTLFCGQCFRFEALGDGLYRGVALDRVLSVRQCGDTLEFPGTNKGEFERLWRNYFVLDVDYAALQELFCRDAVLARAVEYGCGIRVLRQPLFETLISFIISQNNNIKRISGIISRLCATFGEPLGGGYYKFPAPQRLAAAAESDFAPLRAGFRVRYIIDAARRFAAGEIDENFLRTAPLAQAGAMLETICGVGPKVAACTLLFGAGRFDAFPQDVWIKRAMEQLFPGGLPKYVLPYAGIAQQYIFNYARATLQ